MGPMLGFMRLLAVLLSLLLGACSLKRDPVIAFGSPEETFETWREAVERLDTETLILCYAEGSKASMRDEIKSTTREELKAMQTETAQTQFSIEKIVYEGPKAFLRVKRSLKGTDDIEVINMILENGAWRIQP